MSKLLKGNLSIYLKICSKFCCQTVSWNINLLHLPCNGQNNLPRWSYGSHKFHHATPSWKLANQQLIGITNQVSSMMLQGVRLRVVPHFSSGIVERAKRERAWKCRLFSRGVIFTRARVALVLLSLRKNGGLLAVQQGVNVCVATPLHSHLGLKVQYVTKPLILSLCMVFF